MAAVGAEAMCFGTVAVGVSEDGGELLIAERWTPKLWHLVARFDVGLACGSDLEVFGVSEAVLPTTLGCAVADDGSGLAWGTPISPGAVGGRVTGMQRRMVQLGYLASESVSGSYDSDSRAAMIAWQRDNGFVAELMVGELQLSVLRLPYLPTLSGFGVGSLRFGEEANEIHHDAEDWLGPPTSSRFHVASGWDASGEFNYWMTCYAFTLCLFDGGNVGDPSHFAGYRISSYVYNDLPVDPANWLWRTGPLATESGIGIGSQWAEFAEAGPELTMWCGIYDLDVTVDNVIFQVEAPYELLEDIEPEWGDTLPYSPELGEVATVTSLVAGDPFFAEHHCGT